jgi:hypothetical protein
MVQTPRVRSGYGKPLFLRDRRDDGVWLRRQKGEEVVLRLALFDLANGFPAPPDPREKRERPTFVKANQTGGREPSGITFVQARPARLQRLANRRCWPLAVLLEARSRR